MTKTISRREFQRITTEDFDPDTSYLEQVGLGFEERLEAYRNGNFSYIGIWARVEIRVRDTIQIIRSPGLWGIESDSDHEYLDSVYQEECDVLAEILTEMGWEVTA